MRHGVALHLFASDCKTYLDIGAIRLLLTTFTELLKY